MKTAWGREEQEWRPLEINSNKEHWEKILEENFETLNKLWYHEEKNDFIYCIFDKMIQYL